MPIAVSAFSSEELAARNIVDTFDLPVGERFLTKFSGYLLRDEGFATQVSTGFGFNDRDSRGFRADLRCKASDDLTFDLVAEYVDILPSIQLQATNCRRGVAVATNCNANFVDQFGGIARPVRAPDYTINVQARYKRVLGPVATTLVAGASVTDAYAIGTTGSPPSTNGTWGVHQTYLNAGVTLAPTAIDGLSLTVSCRNCADKNYPVSSLGIFQFLDQPGSWDAQVRYRF